MLVLDMPAENDHGGASSNVKLRRRLSKSVSTGHDLGDREGGDGTVRRPSSAKLMRRQSSKMVALNSGVDRSADDESTANAVGGGGDNDGTKLKRDKSRQSIDSGEGSSRKPRGTVIVPPLKLEPIVAKQKKRSKKKKKQ